MFVKAGNFNSFAVGKLADRERFNHEVIVIPKSYPDSQLLFERRGMQRHELERGRQVAQILFAVDNLNRRKPQERKSSRFDNWQSKSFPYAPDDD